MLAGCRFKLCQGFRIRHVKLVDTMWFLDADLSIAMVHYVKIVDTMWLLDSDLSFATPQTAPQLKWSYMTPS